MTARLGSALILIGLILLVIFALSFSVQQGDVLTLLGGAALCALGLLLRRRAARFEAPSTRFHTLRRALGKDEDEEAP